MFQISKDKLRHELYLGGIFLKLADGIAELAGGVILIFIKIKTLSDLVKNFYQPELAEDPKDLIANYLIHLTQTISSGTIDFAALYLILHGIIKVGLFIALWHKKRWAYPLAEGILALFVIYQLYRYSITQSPILIILSLIDILIIILIRSESRHFMKKYGQI